MDKMKVECRCPMCGKINTVEITESQWWRWQMGEHIQNVAPELSPDEREMLISGICPKCWDNMFGAEE